MKPDKGNNKKNALGLISIILWALVLTMLFRSCSNSYASANQVQVDYSTFREWVVAGLVESVRMDSSTYTITLTDDDYMILEYKDSSSYEKITFRRQS